MQSKLKKGKLSPEEEIRLAIKSSHEAPVRICHNSRQLLEDP